MSTVDLQPIFESIYALLAKHIEIELREEDYGASFWGSDSGLWMDYDTSCLTIGFGASHRHHYPEHEDLRPVIEEFFNMLTRRKRITHYSKGGRFFKEEIEFELGDNQYRKFGRTIYLFVPFWKKTETEVHFEEPLLAHSDMESGINEIYKLLEDLQPRRPHQ